MKLAIKPLHVLLLAAPLAVLRLASSVALPVLLAAGADPAQPASQPEPTLRRLREAGWWPTKADSLRKDYAGTDACAECHKQEVDEQRQTSMARAAWRAAETEVLRSTPRLTLDVPPFSTAITRDRKGSTYTTARGGEAITGQVLWSMGDGTMGQTFMLESGGDIFESQLSYFRSIAGLDLTPGHLPAAPRDMEGAFGQRQSTETAQRCFGCHTTASSVKGQFDQAHATPGITCEACHGPGARHANAMRQNQIEEGQAAILDPALFDPVKLVDYCGACHRTAMDVAAAKDYIPINVRFQPYRLEKSRCWSRPDRRIACTACHNPHEQVVRDATFYDAKCLACHASKTPAPSPVAQAGPSQKSPPCPVAANNCASCHMPKYQVPQMHGKFTDHDIRIVRPGDPYPL